MQEALLGWILLGLGLESSTGLSGDVFALCRGCPWSHPGAEPGKISWHLEIPQESWFLMLSLHSPTPFLLLGSCLATLVAFLESSHPWSMLGAKQALAVTQSMRNSSRNPAARAVFSGGCGSGWHCTKPFPFIPDTLKSPFLCTLSMTKTLGAGQPLAFPYFLLPLANCCGIQSGVSQLNLEIARTVPFSLLFIKEKDLTLGKFRVLP